MCRKYSLIYEREGMLEPEERTISDGRSRLCKVNIFSFDHPSHAIFAYMVLEHLLIRPYFVKNNGSVYRQKPPQERNTRTMVGALLPDMLSSTY